MQSLGLNSFALGDGLPGLKSADDDDEAEELQEDILYMGHLKGLTKHLIEEWENKGPSLTIVDD